MKISLINKKRKSSQFFLAVFFGFLSLSFFHSHTFDYKVNNSSEISEENNNQFTDPLLDSEFNCTILSFNNSITIQNDFEEAEHDLTFSSSVIDCIQNFNSIASNTSNHLRAPPEILV